MLLLESLARSFVRTIVFVLFVVVECVISFKCGAHATTMRNLSTTKTSITKVVENYSLFIYISQPTSRASLISGGSLARNFSPSLHLNFVRLSLVKSDTFLFFARSSVSR